MERSSWLRWSRAEPGCEHRRVTTSAAASTGASGTAARSPPALPSAMRGSEGRTDHHDGSRTASYTREASSIRASVTAESSSFLALAIQRDGKIVAVTSGGVVVRYTSRGTTRPHVPDGRRRRWTTAHAIALTLDGKIVIAGQSGDGTVPTSRLRATPTGALDRDVRRRRQGASSTSAARLELRAAASATRCGRCALRCSATARSSSARFERLPRSVATTWEIRATPSRSSA